MISVQGVRDLVRPVITISITFAYVGIIAIATWKGSLSGKDTLAAIATPFMMILTYHFSKSSQVDKDK